MPKTASGRFIVLGVSGGIAAYKSAELVRLLTDRGHQVQVVMTKAAQRFIGPLTFASLTGRKVITDLFEDNTSPTGESAIEHISVAQQADLLLVAPATADVIAKFAHGLADDFLTTMHLAYDGPVVIAPAMNTNMWAHPATRENIAQLAARGVTIIDPDAGDLACGMVGPGRLAEPERIANAAEQALLAASPATRDLESETVLLTAGPTCEPLDPVRFLSNRSSGRMGYALAEEARARGARVILVSGPVALAPPRGCELVAVETADQMHQAVLEHLSEATVFVSVAAVADYRPRAVAPAKLKKQTAALTLELDPTPDILQEVGRLKGNRTVVGFAAETDDVVEHARAKLTAKNCDLIVANPVGSGAAGTGFGSSQNQGWLVDATGAVALPPMAKREMAARILDRVAEIRRKVESSVTAR
ncbi:MAG TPA: bifunctional phosphopantothenoylcysteine decarboxylase/phosphopantothenate--cysteine ligase CoaBC [Bryobacterales bacterium]|nr:bifunctional phosphopantothenoylcysteine decarboxylase/phosphopantothenate--cysteine ligase CoaBC [Bryobacterales bacterium]